MPICCWSQIRFNRIYIYNHLLFCICVNLYDFTELFIQFGTLYGMRCSGVWFDAMHIDIKVSQLLSNIITDENEQPTWSKQIAKNWCDRKNWAKHSSKLQKPCRQKSEWRFPIERPSWSIKEIEILTLSTDLFVAKTSKTAFTCSDSHTMKNSKILFISFAVIWPK